MDASTSHLEIPRPRVHRLRDRRIRRWKRRFRLVSPLLGIPALLATLSLSVGLIEYAPQLKTKYSSSAQPAEMGLEAASISPAELQRAVSVISVLMPTDQKILDTHSLPLENAMQQSRTFPSPETIRSIR